MIRFFFVSSWRQVGGALLLPLSWAAVGACTNDDVETSSKPEQMDGGPAHVPDASDGGSDAGNDVETDSGGLPTIDSFADVSRWRRFDPAPAFQERFMSAGGIFDGQFVYIVSGRTSDNNYAFTKILRHDPRKAFDDLDSWSKFDPASKDLDVVAGSNGTVFDGRFIYILTPTTADYDDSRVVLRYDTKAGGAFDAVSAWSSVDVTSLMANPPYYGSSVLANGVLYLVSNAGTPHLVRYELSKEFTDLASWDYVNLRGVNPVLFKNGNFSAAVFDGRYITLIPATNASIVARYDTTLPADSPAAWEGFDTTALSLQARSFRGATFDGRYIYFAPNIDETIFKVSSSFVRFDTTGALTDFDSWAVMPVAQVSTIQAYTAGTFDGRYVYYAPGAANPTALRVDTKGAFSDPASWESFALTNLDTTARSYAGATFDGTYVYFSPNYRGPGSSVTAPLLRFKAVIDRN